MDSHESYSHVRQAHHFEEECEAGRCVPLYSYGRFWLKAKGFVHCKIIICPHCWTKEKWQSQNKQQCWLLQKTQTI